MEAQLSLATFDAAAYTVGAILGFYVLLTPLKFSKRTLPGVEDASWLLSLFLFSQALWAFCHLALPLLGMALGFPSIAEIFWLVGQGALTLFLLRLTSADPAHNRFGAAAVALMIVGLNALLVRFVLAPSADGAGNASFVFSLSSFIIAQLVLVAIQLMRCREEQSRVLWMSMAVGLAAEFFYQGHLIGIPEVFNIAATIIFGIAIPLQLVRLERRGWPKFSEIMSSYEMRISSSAFLLLIYLLLFAVYFYSRSASLPLEGRLYDNIFFFLSACWLYLLFGAVAWYAAFHIGKLEQDAKWGDSTRALGKVVAQRTRQLALKIRELERFERVSIGREMRIAELKARLKGNGVEK